MTMTKDATITTTELLAGLHEDGNRSAWDEFDRRYRPILIGFLRRSGLSEADAADVAQETLACFLRDYRLNKYDRAQGRLRTWLIAIARFRVADLRRTQGKRGPMRGESAIKELTDEDDPESIWESEERRFVFGQAVDELRRTARFNERTVEAFERVVLRQEPIEQVASQMGLTAQQIYHAKNRVVEKLREIIARYEVGFAGA